MMTQAETCTAAHRGVVSLSDGSSQAALAGGGRAQHAHLAGDAGVGRQQVGTRRACELHQSLR